MPNHPRDSHLSRVEPRLPPARVYLFEYSSTSTWATYLVFELITPQTTSKRSPHFDWDTSSSFTNRSRFFMFFLTGSLRARHSQTVFYTEQSVRVMKDLYGQIDRVWKKTPNGKRKTPITPESSPGRSEKPRVLSSFHHSKWARVQNFYYVKISPEPQIYS